jgi:hypothetical protein
MLPESVCNGIKRGGLPMHCRLAAFGVLILVASAALPADEVTLKRHH